MENSLDIKKAITEDIFNIEQKVNAGKKITRDELLIYLQYLKQNNDDWDYSHIQADKALVAYIHKQDITLLYDAIDKYYS